MINKENWQETQERFTKWWKGENVGRPLIRVVSKKHSPDEAFKMIPKAATPEEFYLNVDRNIMEYDWYCRTHDFLAEAFPNFSVDIGPGSLALYIGSEPDFSWETVWYKEYFEGLDDMVGIGYDPENYWWKKHKELIGKAVRQAGDKFRICVPDLIENLDILASLRGTQNLIYDIIDEPDLVRQAVKRIDDVYFKYYDEMYELVKDKDGSSCYTCFQIWGPGRTAKIQCDISALLSPDQFRDLVQDSLRKQCKRLDNSMYHLDGPDAIKHLDALMEIEELDALQWTCGAGQPDGGCEKWYPIYDKVRGAGKSLWISISDGDIKDWVDSVEKLIKRYGTSGMFLLFPEMEEADAKALIERAEKDWK